MFLLGSIRIRKSGLFEGATDFHCHILPGVDDGFRNVEDSLAALTEYEKLGIRRVFLTPHVMEDIPNTPDNLRERFKELCSLYSGPVQIELASENMMDSMFTERLEKGEVIPLCGNKLLVETSFFNPPIGMDSILESIKAKGFTPVLAHPERYIYMSDNDYKSLKDRGILFQLNLFSLSGHYGDGARAKALKLLSNGCYELAGTDLHRLSSLDKFLDSSLKKGVVSKVKDLIWA